ncbi:MAG: aspartyl/asparaginyl beta-hydroxylase domain-containing protein [Hyphomicrobiales bacterium]|nr:aspartyl/asparaginyl beta-hydroxylase domain-containing protein [Hyphomicrobiales bacterium]
MTSLDRSQLRELATARKRILHKLLAELPQKEVVQFLEFYTLHKEKNILADAISQRAARNLETNMSAYLSENYEQIELQTLTAGGDPYDRLHYVKPVDASLVSLIESRIGACYRTRISTLKPGGVIRRHVDDPRQLRVICILKGQQKFTFFKDNNVLTVPMRQGEFWFINTAWEHEVSNPGDTDRIALLANLFEIPER